MKRLSVGLGVAILVTWGSMLSCEKEAIKPNYSDNQLKADKPDIIYQVSEICGDITTKRLIASKEITGMVYFYNDAKFLYVDAHASGGNAFEDAFLYVGPRGDVPMNLDGEIAPQKFDYKLDSDDLGRSVRFRVPLKKLDGTFVVGMMVKTVRGHGNLEEYDPLKLRNSWVEGDVFNSIGKGQIFKMKKEVCMISESEGLDE